MDSLLQASVPPVGTKPDAPDQIAEREALLRSAVDAGKLGAWVWDIKQNHVTWSDRIYEFHGVGREEFGGTVEAFSKLVHPEDLPKLRAVLEKALSERAPYELEFRAVRPDGTIRWLKTSARVVYSDSGEPLRMVGGVIDLTERRYMEEMLRSSAKHLEAMVYQRTARLEESMREMERVSYSIAHDMRAPLRAIQGFASLLQDECRHEFSAQAREYIRLIVEGAERMDQLIHDVLAYTKVTQEEIKLAPVKLDRLLLNIINADPTLHPPAARIKCPENLPTVLGNETALTQVFWNLLNNAAKFVKVGELPDIEIIAQPLDGNSLRVGVRDKGIGIAPRHHHELFQMFKRLNTTYEGTGIGLAIVRRAAERMGGKVGLESEEGKGSLFWVELQQVAEGL